MPQPSTIALFLLAALVLVIVPGPNILYIVARGVHQGRTAGLVSALGVEAGTLLTKDAAREAAAPPPAPLRAIFWQGVTVNVLNPKTALFFLAFLPQFVDPAGGPVGGQILVLGCLLAALGLASDCVYALLAGGVGGLLKGSARFRAGERWVVGVTYLGLGAATAVADVSPRR